MKALNPGVGTAWSEKDLAQARKLRGAGGLSFHEIGRALNRSADAVAAILASEQVLLGRTVYGDIPFGHVIGSPKVVVDRRKDGATVSAVQAPWGMRRIHLEFLSPNDPGIELFKRELIERLSLLAERELERLERRQQAKDEARRRRGR